MNRSRRIPSILREQGPLLLLIAVIFLVWIAQEIGPKGWDDAFMAVPAKITESWRHLRAGSVGMADLGHLGTLLSSAFLHGGAPHVLYNLLYLWIFAALIVEYLGQGWFLLVFFLSAVTGGIGHTLLDPTDVIPMLGASGAVMGFEGAYLGLALTRQLPDPQVWPLAHPIPPSRLAAVAVIGLVIDFHEAFGGSLDFIAHGAHIGGFVAGFFLTSIALPANAGR